MNMYDQILQHRDALKKANEIIKALNHPVRLTILQRLQSTGRATVTQIYFDLRMDQSAASQHLAILRKADIVKTEREGKNIFYSINEEVVSHILSTFSNL